MSYPATAYLEVRWITPLQSRKSLNSVFIAEHFSLGGTVNICNKLGLRASEVSNELIPIRLESLAVPTPVMILLIFVDNFYESVWNELT